MAALPVIMAATAIIGGAVSAASAIQQGQTAEKAANFNATIAKQNADSSLMQADAEAQRHSQQVRMQLGDMRANYGASGIQIDGSPLDTIEASARRGQMDIENIKYAGMLKSRGYHADAAIDNFEGQSAKNNSYYGASASLLSSAGSAMSAYNGKGKA